MLVEYDYENNKVKRVIMKYHLLIFSIILMIFLSSDLEADILDLNPSINLKQISTYKSEIINRQHNIRGANGTILLVDAYFKKGNLIGKNTVYYKNGNIKLYAEIQQNPEDSQLLSGYCKKYSLEGILIEYIEFSENVIITHTSSDGTNLIINLDSLQINKTNDLFTSMINPLRSGFTDYFTIYETHPKPLEVKYVEFPSGTWNQFKDDCGLQVEVFYDGSIGAIKILKSLASGPGGLDEAAVNSVKMWKFEPALQNQRGVSCWIYIQIHFDSINRTISLKKYDNPIDSINGSINLKVFEMKN